MAEITGVRDIDRKLDRLDKKVGKRVGRAAVNAGLRVVVKEIKQRVPPAKTKGHSGKRLKRATTSVNKKNRRTHVDEAKAGAVGKVKKKAPHYHLIALGTAERHDRGRNRGAVKPNDFVKRAGLASQSAMLSKMREKAKERIAAEAAKASG